VYVPANDELAFATAIDALLRDPELRRQMGEGGRDRVEQELSWDVSRIALVQFYDTCFAREQSRNNAVSKLAWYVGRVAAMSPREMGWRARRFVAGGNSVGVVHRRCRGDRRTEARPGRRHAGPSWSEQGVRRGFAIDSSGDGTVATLAATPAVSLMGES